MGCSRAAGAWQCGRSASPQISKKLKNKHVVMSSGGYAHSVAMTADGKVYAWGCGTYGQCGNGGIQKVNKPQRVHLRVRLAYCCWLLSKYCCNSRSCSVHLGKQSCLFTCSSSATETSQNATGRTK
ncbi:unnamed protein product [Meganyctiphanes norvegica]|uniref:Uncharacterized protein n=1 Tax=Meganyctiphanes norvegica TaxID=48144 RepID=A0AAV2SSG4_MEGNR